MRAAGLSLLVSASLFAPDAFASSMRCGSRLITAGTAALVLEEACGSPDHVDRRLVTRGSAVAVGRGWEGAVRRTLEEVETWTYAGGGGEMMRIVTIRRGEVERIRTVAVRGGRTSERCVRPIFATPTLTGQVELTCGAPDDRDAWIEEEILRDRVGRVLRRTVHHERWIYNPGPGHLLRIFEFEDGKLVRESTGARSRK